MARLITPATPGGDDFGGMMEQMQTIILGPIMESIRAANPNGPDIGPAINQIMTGFRALNAAMVPAPAPTVSTIGGDDVVE